MSNVVLLKLPKQVVFLILWLNVIISGATTTVTANVVQLSDGTQVADNLTMNSMNSMNSKKLTEAEEVSLAFNEVAHYFDSALKFYVALGVFSQIYTTNTPEITCRYCPKRSLPCDELIVKVQAKAMDKAIGAKDSIANEARKNMLSIYHEITQLLYIGSLDDIRKLMAKIAQEKEIPCEDCQKVEWRAVGVSRSAI